MKKLSLLAILLFAGCAVQATDSGQDGPTIHIVNNGDQASEVTLSDTADCGKAYQLGKSVDKGARISVAGGELATIAMGRMSYLCTGQNAAGAPITPGVTYAVGPDGVIVGEYEERN